MKLDVGHEQEVNLVNSWDNLWVDSWMDFSLMDNFINLKSFLRMCSQLI